jgi:hypothetical protein
MVTTVVKQNTSRKSVVQNDDFARYIEKQTLTATFNGTKLAKFSKYKKIMGLM